MTLVDACRPLQAQVSELQQQALTLLAVLRTGGASASIDLAAHPPPAPAAPRAPMSTLPPMSPAMDAIAASFVSLSGESSAASASTDAPPTVPRSAAPPTSQEPMSEASPGDWGRDELSPAMQAVVAKFEKTYCTIGKSLGAGATLTVSDDGDGLGLALDQVH